MKYCTYITMYSGELLPKWYIGSSTIEKIKKGQLLGNFWGQEDLNTYVDKKD